MESIEKIIKSNNNETVLKAVEKLPQRLREFVLNPKINITIKSITDESGMSVKFPQVKTYTIMTLAGILPISKFREVIETRLMIDTNLARKIATEIRDKVFMEVADELRKIHGLDK